MSGKEEIKNAIQKFMEQRRSLAGTANAYAQQKPEEKETFLKSISQENIQTQLDTFFVDLNMGRYDISDFSKIEEFCGAYDSMFANDSIRKQIANLKEQMNDKRLLRSKEIELKTTPELRADLHQSDKLSNVVISFDHQKIKNGHSIAGKTFTFLDSNGDALNMVEFDENGNGYIHQLGQDGKEVEYVLTRDSKFYQMKDGKPHELALKQDVLSPQDKRAVNSIFASRNLWKAYTQGKLDHLVQKETKLQTLKVNEAAKAKSTKVNEGQGATTVNEGAPDEPVATSVNEGKSNKKDISDFGNDTTNKHAPGHNEFKWQEMDIIDAMFKEWFLAAANAATSWVLDQTEYLLTGIVSEISRGYDASKAEGAKRQNDPDETQKFADSLQRVSNQKMEAIATKTKNKKIIKDIKEGKLDTVIAENPLLKDFAELSGVNIGQLLTSGEPEKTVPLMTNLALSYLKTVDDYARASLLDEKLHDKNAHNGKDVKTLYEERRQQAAQIIQKKLAQEAKRDPEASHQFDFYQTTISQMSKHMEKALKLSKKEFNAGHYDEKDVRTKNNLILIEYKGLLSSQETSMQEEAEQQRQNDQSQKEKQENLRIEAQNLGVRSKENAENRKQVESHKKETKEETKEANKKQQQQTNTSQNTKREGGRE